MKGLPSGFSIFGLDVKFYGILMALAMLVGILVACKNSKFRNLKPEDIYTIALYALPIALVGARLFYVLGDLSSYSSFWDIFKVWEGGMSIYGAIIGGVFAIVLYSLIHKKHFFNVSDIAVVSLVLGQAIGRWGNFFNQEVYGAEVTNNAFQWFPFSVLLENGEWHYALFFYEFLINLAIFALLFYLLKKVQTKGYITGAYLIAYGTIRFLLEPLRMAEYNLMLWGIKLSSLTSIFAIVAGIAIIVLIYTKSKRGGKVER